MSRISPMRRGYFGDTGSQVHYREVAPVTSTDEPPLLCLPPSPHTGAFYASVMPLLNANRRVVAVDYPGYGGTDRSDEVSIPAYAQSLFAMVDRFGPVDLLGFHTGNLVAAEIAKAQPEKVRKIVMIDIPFFDADTRKTYGEKFSTVALPTPIEAGFEKAVTNRNDRVSEDRGFEVWVETLRAGRYQNDAFRAAFAYDCQAEFAKLSANIAVIATQSNLLDLTRQAAKVIKGAHLTERLEITAPAFEAHKQAMAEAILAAIAP